MKVSIITVTYNSGHTLHKTIQSILSQTYADIEYIIVDGLSGDNTLDIIQHFVPSFGDRLKVISEKDEGLYDAMNKGIKIATGDIVGILNSDDFFTDDKVIETIVKHFSDDIDAIYGDIHFVKLPHREHCIRYYSGKIFRPWLLRFGFTPPHPSFYIRRKVFEQYGGYDLRYKIAADFDLIARLCYIHRIPTKYIHLDIVTMSLGGVSTKNFKARKLGSRENYIACKNLGIKTLPIFIYFKYLIKIGINIFIKH